MRLLLSFLAAVLVVVASTNLQSIKRLEAVRELMIGSGDDARHNLTEVTGMTVGPDGSMYVVQHQEAHVKVFSPKGDFVQTIGRRGKGPGEFTSPRWVGWKADTLWVSDVAASRVNLYDPRGAYRSQIAFVKQAASPGLLETRPGFLMSDGSVLSATEALSEDLATGRVASLPLLRTDRQGERVRSLVSNSARNMLASVKFVDRPGGFYFEQPFSDAALWAIGPKGGPIVVVSRSEPTTSRRATFTLVAISPEGDTILRRTYEFVPVPLNRSLRDHWIASQLRRFRNAPSWFPTINHELYVKHLYTPKFMPPVTAVVVGLDSSIWLQREYSGRPISTWWLLDRSGIQRAFVELPSHLKVMTADARTVWGVELDSLDVPQVMRYRIQESARAKR